MVSKVYNYDLSSPSWTTQLSTGLNSLASGSSAVSSAITRTRDRNRKVSIKLASFTPGSGAYFELHQLKKLDTGDYEDQSSDTLVAMREIVSGTAAKYFLIEDLPNPNVDFKWAFKNIAGASLPSSGSTLADITDGPEIQ